MKVEMYSMNGCGYCLASKQWFRANNIEITEYQINDREKRQEFYIETAVATGKNIRSMPQIWIDGKHIGGYFELIESNITISTSFNEDF